jgi:ADP-dependent NAD(P)H-hydrate dehydratase / NAD(P)H-hydrate epimerase
MSRKQHADEILYSANLLLDAVSARSVDERTIRELGISGDTLMEVAGAKSADLVRRLYPNLRRVMCICGKGNNGGDGLVVARHLLNNGISTIILLTHPEHELSGSATLNLKRLRVLSDGYRSQYNINNSASSTTCQSEISSDIIFADESFDWTSLLGRHQASDITTAHTDIATSYTGRPVEQPDVVEPDFDTREIIVDALFGTGLSSALHGVAATAADAVNRCRLPVVSLDIASGLNATNGNVTGTAIKATHTFCMGYLKIGCFLENGPWYSGQPHRIDLGFPEYMIENGKHWLISQNLADKLPIVRAAREHKYASGVVHVIGGSKDLSGAVILAALSAWKSGCGAVFVHVPKALSGVVAAASPHLICYGYGKENQSILTMEHVSTLLENLNKRPGTVLLGPGLGLDESTAAFVTALMRELTANLIVDADGLKLMDLQTRYPGECILTPHPGELNYLTSGNFESASKRLELVKSMAVSHQLTIVSKGNPGIVASKYGDSWITGYDTRRFARAGFGDVLSGKIAGYWAQSGQAEFSCIHALWHGKIRYDAVVAHGHSTPEPLDCL